MMYHDVRMCSCTGLVCQVWVSAASLVRLAQCKTHTTRIILTLASLSQLQLFGTEITVGGFKTTSKIVCSRQQARTLCISTSISCTLIETFTAVQKVWGVIPLDYYKK